VDMAGWHLRTVQTPRCQVRAMPDLTLVGCNIATRSCGGASFGTRAGSPRFSYRGAPDVLAPHNYKKFFRRSSMQVHRQL